VIVFYDRPANEQFGLGPGGIDSRGEDALLKIVDQGKGIWARIAGRGQRSFNVVCNAIVMPMTDADWNRLARCPAG